MGGFKERRSCYLHSCCLLGDQALLYLGNPFLPLALHGQSSAAHAGGTRHPDGQPLLTRQHDRGLRALLSQALLTAEPMELRGKEQDSSHGMRVRHLTGQGERSLTPLQGLLRIAQPPQHPGRKREAKDSGSFRTAWERCCWES